MKDIWESAEQAATARLLSCITTTHALDASSTLTNWVSDHNKGQHASVSHLSCIICNSFLGISRTLQRTMCGYNSKKQQYGFVGNAGQLLESYELQLKSSRSSAHCSGLLTRSVTTTAHDHAPYGRLHTTWRLGATTCATNTKEQEKWTNEKNNSTKLHVPHQVCGA